MFQNKIPLQGLQEAFKRDVFTEGGGRGALNISQFCGLAVLIGCVKNVDKAEEVLIKCH